MEAELRAEDGRPRRGTVGRRTPSSPTSRPPSPGAVVPMLVGRARVDVPSRTPGTASRRSSSSRSARRTGRRAERGGPAMMLSRIAESMFWIGRYVERAEDTARLLQTHLRLLVEDSSTEMQASANLLALMSVEGVEEPDPHRPAAPARVRPARAELDLLLLGGRPGQRPTGPRGHPAGPVGVHQHHLAPAAVGRLRGRPGQRLPELGPRAQRPVRRHRPRHDGPRRRVAVPVAGPLPGAGRHDLAAGRLRVGLRRGVAVAVGAARLRRARRLPADLPRRAQRRLGGRVPHPGRPLPALDHARPQRRLGLPGQARGRRRATPRPAPPRPAASSASCAPASSTPT